MFTSFKPRMRAWITGLRSYFCAPPAAEREAGALAFFHIDLERIGNGLNVWRMRNERDRDFAFRIAVAIANRLNELEADLDRVINFDKR